MESNIQFTLPNIGTSQMTRDDQGALIVNQATAAIISAYLNHATETFKHLLATGKYLNEAGEMRQSPSELIKLIDSVQNALRTF